MKTAKTLHPICKVFCIAILSPNVKGQTTAKPLSAPPCCAPILRGLIHLDRILHVRRPRCAIGSTLIHHLSEGIHLGCKHWCEELSSAAVSFESAVGKKADLRRQCIGSDDRRHRSLCSHRRTSVTVDPLGERRKGNRFWEHPQKLNDTIRSKISRDSFPWHNVVYPQKIVA